MTADVELLPCPFCGSAEHLHVEHLEGTSIHPAYRVRCDFCGASTRYTDRDYRTAWNTRTNVAPATTAKDAEAANALKAAREDSERLDWLLHALYRQDVVACGGEAYITMRCVGVPPADANEIRAAIDAAMEATGGES